MKRMTKTMDKEILTRQDRLIDLQNKTETNYKILQATKDEIGVELERLQALLRRKQTLEDDSRDAEKKINTLKNEIQELQGGINEDSIN